LESIDPERQAGSVAVPDWIKAIVPVTSIGTAWKTYFWPGAAPAAEFHATSEQSLKAVVDSARFDIWLEPDGSIAGWLGLNLSKNMPSALEFDWPIDAHPTALSVAGEFLVLPVPDSGVWAVPLPASAKGGLVWLSWASPRSSQPPLSAPLAARVPWPRNVPVERCSMNLHAPAHFRIESERPFVATATRSPPEALPPLVSTLNDRVPDSGAGLSLTLSPVPPPGAGSGSGFELGAALRVVNEWPRQLLVSFAIALLIAVVCWKTAPFWNWLARHETASWLVLSVIWCVWLNPGWVGALIALCACARALFRRDRETA
jgi:hypothetical protein